MIYDTSFEAARRRAVVVLVALLLTGVAFVSSWPSREPVHGARVEPVASRSSPKPSVEPVEAASTARAERANVDAPGEVQSPAAAPRRTRVVGRVMLADGRPIDAWVSLQRATEPDGEWTSRDSRRANAAGKVELETSAPGQYRLLASHARYGTAVFGPLVIDGSGQDVHAHLTLTGDGMLAGIVRDVGGEPLPHLKLRARVVAPARHPDGTGFTTREFESDRDGRFHVRGLVVGEFTIDTLRYDHWNLAESLTPVPVRSDREDLELVSRCARLLVRVRDQSGALVRVDAGPDTRGGNPAPHAVYVVALAEDDRVLAELEHQFRATLLDLNDTTCSAEVEPGLRYAVGVVSREHALVEHVVAIDEPGTRVVELQLGPHAPATELAMTVTPEGVEKPRWFPVKHELRSPTSGALLWRRESTGPAERVAIGPGEYDYRADRAPLRGCGNSAFTSVIRDRWAPVHRRVLARPGVATPVDVSLTATGTLALEVSGQVPYAPGDGRLPTRGVRMSPDEFLRDMRNGVRVRLERDGAPLLPTFDIHPGGSSPGPPISVGWVPTNRRYETCRGIPAGRYRLVVEHEGLRTLERDVEIRSAETTEVRLTLLD